MNDYCYVGVNIQVQMTTLVIHCLTVSQDLYCYKSSFTQTDERAACVLSAFLFSVVYMCECHL